MAEGTFTIDTEKGIITNTFSGNIGYTDIMMLMAEVTESKFFSPDFHSLVIIEEYSTINFMSPAGNPQTRDLLEKYTAMRPNSKFALVLSPQEKEYLDMGIETLGDISGKFRTFDKEEDALNWIEE